MTLCRRNAGLVTGQMHMHTWLDVVGIDVCLEALLPSGRMNAHKYEEEQGAQYQSLWNALA